jgi:hypothetical protein
VFTAPSAFTSCTFPLLVARLMSCSQLWQAIHWCACASGTGRVRHHLPGCSGQRRVAEASPVDCGFLQCHCHPTAVQPDGLERSGQPQHPCRVLGILRTIHGTYHACVCGGVGGGGDPKSCGGFRFFFLYCFLIRRVSFHKLHKSTGYPKVQDRVGRGKGWERWGNIG